MHPVHEGMGGRREGGGVCQAGGDWGGLWLPVAGQKKKKSSIDGRRALAAKFGKPGHKCVLETATGWTKKRVNEH